jgi:hypothetical protein
MEYFPGLAAPSVLGSIRSGARRDARINAGNLNCQRHERVEKRLCVKVILRMVNVSLTMRHLYGRATVLARLP